MWSIHSLQMEEFYGRDDNKSPLCSSLCVFACVFVNEGTCVDFLSLFFIVIQGHVADLKIKLTLVRLHFNSTPRGNPESGSPVQVCCLSLLPMASADPRLWDLNRGLHMVFA